MGGGGGGGDQKTEVRYADYVEKAHKDFLNVMKSKRNAVIDDSPYTGFTDISYEVGFFGAGYTIASFPSLYDMHNILLWVRSIA